MTRPRRFWNALPVSCAVVSALGLVAWLDRRAPAPIAATTLGTEDAFAEGLHLRELPPGQRPQRWTTERARFRFRNLPPGPSTLEVQVRGQRGPVMIVADGAIVGRLEPGNSSLETRLPDTGRRARDVELQAEGFVAGDGRRLGALLERVTLRHAPPAWPGFALLLCFALPASLATLGACRSGWGAWGAWLAGVAVAGFQGSILWPHGLLRSPYAARLALLLAAGSIAAWLLARAVERVVPRAAAGVFAAALCAWIVQGVLATAPHMVVSDAVFHANNLARVSGGELLLTSATQHARPFRFPYGVSFYAVLAPFHRAGVDPVALVRWGAALAGVLASWGLLVALARLRGAAPAAAAVIALQLLPVTFDVYSFGNLSNAFAQAATAGFFAWWLAGTRGWPWAAVLLAVAGTAHLSAFIVSLALAGALWMRERIAHRRLERARLLALAGGLGLAAAYYACFASLIVEQLPRLLEGGGQGRGASQGALGALWLQLAGLLGQWGLPAIGLAIVGRPRRSGRPGDAGLLAFWIAGALLAAAAVASPLEVRYLYALSLPLAVAAGDGFLRLWHAGSARRALALLSGALQAALAAHAVVEALLRRYR